MNMPDFGRTGDTGDNEPSLDDIRRTDSFVDALAGGGPVASDDPADAALAALLGGWRDEMRWPPATGLISEPQAIAALDAGLAEKPGGLRRDKRTEKQLASVTSMKNRRGLSLLGAAAAAVLGIGGFVALYNGPTPVRDDAVVLAARTELEQVQQLITQGDWQQAQEKLVAVSTQVASIGDERQKQDLFDEFNDLSAKVVERNPEATAAPGIIYTVPPAATELVPAVAPPTSVPTATSPSDPTSAATSAEQTGTSASPNSTTATSGAPTSSQSPASATSTQTVTPTTTPTSAAPATTSAPAASSSAAPSAASSSPSPAQATSSAAATTTSAAPRVASSSPASSPVSTTAAVPATTTTAPVASPAQASTTQPQATVQTTAAPTEDSSPADSSPADSSPAESAPTTTAVPIPVTTTTVPVAAG